MATGGQVLLGGNRSSAALRTLLLLCSEVRTVRARVLCSSSGTHGAQPAAQSGGAPGGRRVPKQFKSFKCEQLSVRGVSKPHRINGLEKHEKMGNLKKGKVCTLPVTVSWARAPAASEVVSRADCLAENLLGLKL